METNWQTFLAIAVLSLTAVLGMVWLSRVRAAWRLHAAMNAFADRQIAWARQEKVRRLVQQATGAGWRSRSSRSKATPSG